MAPIGMRIEKTALTKSPTAEMALSKYSPRPDSSSGGFLAFH
jgi:hypothetical protein